MYIYIYTLKIVGKGFIFKELGSQMKTVKPSC